MKNEPTNQEYNDYVEKVTPTHNCFLNCLKAFLVGGIICTIGQIILKFMEQTMNMNKDDASSYVSLILVLLSVLFTGFNIYAPIAKFGGAGALVPITGGEKVFTIAGPVILYGIFTSFILGFIYYILLRMGGYVDEPNKRLTKHRI